MRAFNLLFCLVLILAACTRSLPAVVPTVSVPTNAPEQPENLPGPSPTLPSSIYLPSLSRDAQASTGTCQQHAAEMTIATSSPEIRVGELVTITLSLTNTGNCAMLGLPKYTLVTSADPAGSLFQPANPAPVDHSLGLDPGKSDTATFTLHAVNPGGAVLSGNASFEVHLGYPGPAYWATAASQTLSINVIP